MPKKKSRESNADSSIGNDLDDFLRDEEKPEPEAPPEEEPPKKRRGRPKGSGRKPSASVEGIDRAVVFGFLEMSFAIVVATAGERFAPLDEEKRIIGENLARVLEKRLPDAAAENLPEISLAVGVLGYVARCYFGGPSVVGSSVGHLREEGKREDGFSETSALE